MTTPASQPKSLKRRFFSAAALNITGRISTFLIQTGTTLILARILMPGDFGLVGMVMPVIMVFQVLGNMGLTMAVLQRREVTPAQLSSLFYFNLSISVLLAGVLYLSAPLISNFYDTPQVDPIAQLFSLVILAAGASALQTSLLQRELRFGTILVAQVVSQLGSSAIAIWMALEGFGFMALAWRSVMQPAIYSVIVWLRSGWLPGLPEWSAEVKSMFGFGGFSAGFNLLNTTGRQLDNVLIGWRYGHLELGPYSVGYRLFLSPIRMITSPLGQVVIPTLARMQDEPERFARWYLSILRLITLGVFPPLIALTLFSDELVHVVLGSKWETAAPIIRWLLPVGAMQASYTTIGWLMIATGRADRQFRWAIISVSLYVTGFFIGLPWGAEGVAASYTVTNLMLFMPGFAYGAWGTRIHLSHILSALIPGILAALCAVGLLLCALPFLREIAPFAQLCLAGLVTLCVMVGAVIVAFGWDAVWTQMRSALRLKR